MTLPAQPKPARTATRTAIHTATGKVARKLALSTALTCGTLLASSPAFCADIPWYLGANEKSQTAPSAIETKNIAPGKNPVVVAVIDSGVIGEHPSLAGALLPGYDMMSTNSLRGGRSANYAPDPRDATCGTKMVSSIFRTHGTEVASVIVGNGVNGMLGVNPKAKVVPIRIFGACGVSISDMIDALNWAGGIPVAGVPNNPNPARVINISIAGGGTSCSSALQQTIDRLVAKNVFVVAAAGNNFQKPLPEPANCKGVISVGSVSAENQIEKYSALDPRTTIYSPGGGAKLNVDTSWSVNKIRVATYEVGLLGTENAVVADKGTGTSFAAPVVAGYISLWLSYHPEKTPANWQTELAQFMRSVPTLEKCPDCKPTGLVANMKAF